MGHPPDRWHPRKGSAHAWYFCNPKSLRDKVSRECLAAVGRTGASDAILSVDITNDVTYAIGKVFVSIFHVESGDNTVVSDLLFA